MAVLHAERPWGHIDYKWVALSNTTLGILMASINGSILLIALPAIFRGIGVSPLAPGETPYMLWAIMSYMVVTAVLLVTCGRLSDMFGRVKLYNAGFAVFTLGSVLLFLVLGGGNTAALEIIAFRVVQGIGGAFLFANSAAILTDAFPEDERGMAMGFNQVAAIAGGFIGLVVGGLLADVNWRAVFLISVPFGLIGTVWAYLALHETAPIRGGQTLDLWGNLTFGVGLLVLLIALTYGIEPYGGATMGWTSPWVLGGLAAGAALLVAFTLIETRVPEPMFRLELFGLRDFTVGNLAGFLSSVARGGLQFMLIIWLQGIWLPLHGVAFEQTPLWAGIAMLPLSVGFLLMGPLSGFLSDRWGARWFTVGGLALTVLGFLGLMELPLSFAYWQFAALLVVLGVGLGMFGAPNTASIMNAAPTEVRGVASGMRATFQNTAMTLSITLIFTLVTLGLAGELPHRLFQGLASAGVPAGVATQIAQLPPTGALFAAFLGYNPLATLLPPSVLAGLAPAARAHLLSQAYFPTLIAGPFKSGVAIAFGFCAIVSLIAAIASSFRSSHVPQRHV